MDSQSLECLRGKRLLLLGGSFWKDQIEDFAQKHGIVLLATGNDPSAGMFQIAQEKYDIDSTDAEKMKRLIEEKSVDGVYLGGNEPVITAACQYLAEMGKPCYCTPKQWNALQNKIVFKALCVQYGLPVCPSYKISLENFEEDAKKCEFPVITKPTDGCASIGFRICRNAEELKEGIQNAQAASSSSTVIVEKCVKNDSLIVTYSFSEGKILFTGMCDKYPIRYENGGFGQGIMFHESPRIPEFRANFEGKITKMFADLEITEGSVWIEVFHDGGSYYFNEPGFRYAGYDSIAPVNYYSGVNQIATDIYYALTGKSKITGFDSVIPKKTVRKKYYCIYPIHLNPGRITKVTGIDELLALNEVVVIPVAKNLNAEIMPTGTPAMTYGFVHFVFDTELECRNMVAHILDTFRVLDENGKNMVVSRFDMETVNFNDYR